ncbi:MAG: hypothetical protein V4488_26450 [Pseudomonadota bacterium]
MREGIRFSKIGHDEDFIEIEASVCDGVSFFSTSIYIANDAIEILIHVLKKFKYPEYSGTLPFGFGSFERGMAKGAIKLGLTFDKLGYIFIAAEIQSEHEQLCEENVASKASMHLVADQTMLADFIAELAELESGARTDAMLRSWKVLGRGRTSLAGTVR